MGSYSKALGMPVPYEFDGQTYQVGPVDGITKGLFESWMKAEAWDNLSRLKPLVRQGVMRESEYEEARQTVVRDITGFRFSWLGRDWQAAIVTEAGLVQLLYLALARNHKDKEKAELESLASAMLTERPEEVQLLLTRLINPAAADSVAASLAKTA